MRVLLAAIVSLALAAAQGGPTPAPRNLQGVYQSIPDRMTLPGGLKNAGSPAAIELLPGAAREAKSVDLKRDPWKICQPVGPFRMMAADQTKIELVETRALIVMAFEDLSHGMYRAIHLSRGHPAKLEPTWLGDAVGRWEGDTLVVDTAGFNDKTWLNEEGAQHSDALHLVERIRPTSQNQVLEYKVTADDSKVLARPYTYSRYYKKLDTEVMDDPCEDQQ